MVSTVVNLPQACLPAGFRQAPTRALHNLAFEFTTEKKYPQGRKKLKQSDIRQKFYYFHKDFLIISHSTKPFYMKLKRLLLTISLAALIITTYGQSSKAEEIRKMEQLQVQAVLDQDSTILQRIMANDLIINAATNNVIGMQAAMKALRQGYIHYSSYQQEIDTISVFKNIGIVMGLEIMKPVGITVNAGKTVKRRFTDVWMYKNQKWAMIARQATNISIE